MEWAEEEMAREGKGWVKEVGVAVDLAGEGGEALREVAAGEGVVTVAVAKDWAEEVMEVQG